MKSIKEYINESIVTQKINSKGKKELKKFVDNAIKDIDNILDYYGISNNNEDDVYIDCRDTIWTFVNDNNICSDTTKDEESISFINDEYERLARAICDKYKIIN